MYLNENFLLKDKHQKQFPSKKINFTDFTTNLKEKSMLKKKQFPGWAVKSLAISQSNKYYKKNLYFIINWIGALHTSTSKDLFLRLYWKPQEAERWALTLADRCVLGLFKCWSRLQYTVSWQYKSMLGELMYSVVMLAGWLCITLCLTQESGKYAQQEKHT